MSGVDPATGNPLFWYARPVFFVASLPAALKFYLNRLGFRKAWHSEAGNGTVCQVDRADCEIILAEDPDRRDRGRLFIELTRAGIDELRGEIAERGVPTEKAWWGYDVIKIVDPSGNELLFPLDETNDRERRG
ncbi:MAG: hypothetical protein FJ206_02825 [Gemmatimonadetes bacterium]|nr:hypothetical protein [Gemmatimonadota bacterium]